MMRLLMIFLALTSALAEAGVRWLRAAGAGEFTPGMRILLWQWDFEIAPRVAILIPTDLGRVLESIAAAERKSVHELAVERLQVFGRPVNRPQDASCTT